MQNKDLALYTIPLIFVIKPLILSRLLLYTFLVFGPHLLRVYYCLCTQGSLQTQIGCMQGKISLLTDLSISNPSRSIFQSKYQQLLFFLIFLIIIRKIVQNKERFSVSGIKIDFKITFFASLLEWKC